MRTSKAEILLKNEKHQVETISNWHFFNFGGFYALIGLPRSLHVLIFTRTIFPEGIYEEETVPISLSLNFYLQWTCLLYRWIDVYMAYLVTAITYYSYFPC